jgi:Ferritin-like domain
MAAADPGCPTTGSDTPIPEPSSRGLFFRRALAGRAVMAGGVLAGGLPGLAASAPSPAQDAENFNFALLLECMRARFYDKAARRGVMDGELVDFVEVVRAHEQAHEEYLTDALGAARAEPAFSFEESLQVSVMAAAVALETSEWRRTSGRRRTSRQVGLPPRPRLCLSMPAMPPGSADARPWLSRGIVMSNFSRSSSKSAPRIRSRQCLLPRSQFTRLRRDTRRGSVISPVPRRRAIPSTARSR